ncbi:G2/mitotic-specific cyclin-B3 [Diachasma alloeum]|uniref:Cyclin B3 n=1 Tax=Diachasma alloeum TaxID=454923 RepID=A0A4E0S185_9HYME|nr:G2/mitotic-specific cyclin-B3 [Diachasma alloeum]XP_015118628.1 G2/mitotic-specific cyclin-B3 [Diachasma alloeum]THK33160.1 Cyclin B3 [Diachasma alloeum]
MAPTKIVNSQNKHPNTAIVMRKGITTRNQKAALANNPVSTKMPTVVKDSRIKRKAEASPLKEKTTKRSALGNITNAIGKSLGVQLPEAKRVVKKSQVLQPVKSSAAPAHNLRNTERLVVKTDNVIPAKPKVATRAKVAKRAEDHVDVTSKVTNVRRSLDMEKSEESSLYVSALEDVSEEVSKKNDKNAKLQEKKEKEKPRVVKKESIAERLDAPPSRTLPPGVSWDFDVENWTDPYQVSPYAMEIFEYLKSREKLFPIGDYMEKQVCLSRWMRSLLVDWMVEVQESFELNHETLYLAVKLVDLYLTKVTVGKETLQLLGAASLFIASKFDERIPPMIEDFLYICDGAYNQRELIRMEMNVLKIVDFDLGIPLSYRFLRRYARCAKVSMPTLTLARYILEYSLMDYSTIMFSDSKIAAAALLLALQMKDLGGWTPTLEYYTGYKVKDLREIVKVLNEGLHKKQKDALATVRNKYSHKIFFEVAKVPLKDVLDV